MKRALPLLLLFCFFASDSHAQIHINPGVDTLEADVKKAIRFYSDYLNEFKGKDLPDFKEYWSAKDCQLYKSPDQLLYGISGSYPTYKMGESRTIIYIKPQKEYINIKTHFGWTDSLKNISSLCITNHYIKFDEQLNPSFINPVEINSRSWKSEVLRNITFHFPSYHRFNQQKADSLIAQIKLLESQWELNPINIRYYFANTTEEIYRLRGFDLSIGMGNRHKPSGISDDRDNLVYSSGSGENYFHEVVHIYLNKIYPKSPVREGLAVFYGGSMGQNLQWHIARLKAYLIKHPEIDLNKLEDFWQMDNYTNPGSTIQGMLCNIAFTKDGMDGLKRVMTYESLDELFEKEHGLKAGELNGGLRKLIANQ